MRVSFVLFVLCVTRGQSISDHNLMDVLLDFSLCSNQPANERLEQGPVDLNVKGLANFNLYMNRAKARTLGKIARICSYYLCKFCQRQLTELYVGLGLKLWKIANFVFSRPGQGGAIRRLLSDAESGLLSNSSL